MVREFTLKLLRDDAKIFLEEHDFKVDVKKFESGLSTLNTSLLNGIKVIHENGGLYPTKTDKPCWWDRHTFTTHPIPIPRKLIYGLNGNVLEIHGEGFFYSFENCYAYLKELQLEREIKNLISIFSFIYPEKKLNSASDWRTLKDVGMGDIDIATFRSGHYHVQLTENIYFIPCVVKCKSTEFEN